MTGLRASELASLTPQSFKFIGTLQTVTISAKDSKHRREDVLPLHPELGNELQEWLSTLDPDKSLWAWQMGERYGRV